MNFKTQNLALELSKTTVFLRSLAQEFDDLSQKLGVEPCVTRVLQEISDSSGVHPAGRAIDFRDEQCGIYLYDETKRQCLLGYFNAKYQRYDGHQTLIWHRVQGSTYHFHLQLAPSFDAYWSHP